MDYSIVIPVFNREDLTRQCLAALRPTLAGAGEGEVIVVDNGSRPETTAVLAEFPWVRVIRNEHNLGFAAACNQGARAASGRYVVHLNNDTLPLDGWLARMLARFDEGDVGIVGAKLLFPNDTLQHVGVLLAPIRFGPEGFGPYHFMWGADKNSPAGLKSKDFEVVTGACLVVERALFLELGGFFEGYWNGYEDVDFCLSVRARGLRVVYESSAVLYHFESQSGVQRKRRLMHNIRLLAERWAASVKPDSNRYAHVLKMVRRELFSNKVATAMFVPLPPTTLVVHGPAPTDPVAFLQRLTALHPIARIVWLAEGAVPSTAVAPRASWSQTILAETNVRGDRYLAFVSTQSSLRETWLADLIDSVEFASDIVAAAPRPVEEDAEWPPLSVDAQASIIALRLVPQHVRPDESFATLDGMICDWVYRVVQLGRAVRRLHRPSIDARPALADAVFSHRHGMSIAQLCAPDFARLEESSQPHVGAPTFASIVMLSWNAPEFTELAVASIRKFTPSPYEIIIVDNGSGEDTVKRLEALDGVRVIYNDRNMGFAHGCNQGMAAALGTHVVLLNNDVIVSSGWLEALLDAHRVNPALGISAPRSNYVAGHQQVHDARYSNIDEMHAFAFARSRKFRSMRYATDRVIGFCMCISRSVINEVGGIDTRYPVGNFEDDDYCLRVRAAGYEIAVCEDSFIHHFGSVSFKANKIDYGAQLGSNWKIFARRWNLPTEYPTNGYNPLAPIGRGFNPDTDYFPLPALPMPADSLEAPVDREYDLAFVMTVSDETDWSRIAPFVGNYLSVFGSEDAVVAMIAARGACDAALIGVRIERTLSKLGIAPERAADIDIADVGNLGEWTQSIVAARRYAVFADAALPDFEPIAQRNPSALRRLLGTVERT